VRVRSTLVNTQEITRRLASAKDKKQIYFGPGELDAARYEELLAHPDMNAIEALAIVSDESLGDNAALILARSPWLAHARVLALAGCGIRDAGVVALVSNENFRGVRAFDLRDNGMRGHGYGFGPDGSPFRAMFVNYVGDNGYAAIAESPYTKEIRELDLSHTVPTHEGVKKLLLAPIMAQLRTFKLESCSAFGESGARAIAGRRDLGLLEELKLRHCGLRSEGALGLSCAQSLNHLTKLDLRVNEIRSSGISALAATEMLPSLVELDLRDNPIYADDVKVLAKRTGLPKLGKLGVSGSLQTDEYVEYTDWDGTVVGGGHRLMDPKEIESTYFSGLNIAIY
jgi:hypothetical protein